MTELARLSDSSWTTLFGTLPLIDPSVVPFDDDARRAVLAGQLADFLDDEADVRVVQLLDVLAVHRPRDLLVEVPGVGEEVDHDRLGEDLVLSPWIDPALVGANWTSYSFFWLAYFASLPSFWITEKSIT